MNGIQDVASYKERLRNDLLSQEASPTAGIPSNEIGRTAEKLRQAPQYQAATTIMVSLHPSLHQVRLNAVTDRKRLVLPTPGLRSGFLSIGPRFVPPGKRNSAVQPYATNPFAAKIPYDPPPAWHIDLLVTDSLMAGMDGGRLGDGTGHLDLQAAILITLGWTSRDFRIATVVPDSRIVDTLPMKPSDMGVHLIVTPKRLVSTSLCTPPVGRIEPAKLPPREFKRNDALFFLFRKAFSPFEPS